MTQVLRDKITNDKTHRDEFVDEGACLCGDPGSIADSKGKRPQRRPGFRGASLRIVVPAAVWHLPPVLPVWGPDGGRRAGIRRRHHVVI